jgi:WD40 repeat protein
VIEHRSPQSGIASFGPWIATAGYDNQVILWDRESRRALSRANHDHLANHGRFTADGRHLVTASSDHTARRWSVPDLQLLALYAEHDDDVEMAVPHPTDGRVATASRDHRVRVFDERGPLLATGRGHDADVLTVVWVAGGRELLSSGDDGTLRRWDPVDGRLLHTIDLGSVETDTVIHHDGLDTTIAGTDAGHLVIVRGSQQTIVPAHDAGIKQLAIEPQAGLVLSASYDRRVRLWQLSPTGLEPRRTFDAPPDVWLRAVTIVDRRKAAFGTFGSTFALLDLETGTWDLEGVAPTSGVNAVRVVDGVRWTVGDAGIVSADGRPAVSVGSLCNFIGAIGSTLVTGGQTGELFEIPTGRVLLTHRSPLNCSVTVRVGDRELLVVGTYTGEALVLEQQDGALAPVATLELHENAIKGLAVSGTHVFSVSATAAAAVHDLADRRCVRHDAKAHDKIANGAAAIGDRFVSVSRDLTLRVFSHDGERLGVVTTPHTHSIKCVAAHPREPLVATGSYDGTVGVFDVTAHRWISFRRPTCSGISSLTFDEGQDAFLAASFDGGVYAIPARASDAQRSAGGSVPAPSTASASSSSSS